MNVDTFPKNFGWKITLSNWPLSRSVSSFSTSLSATFEKINVFSEKTRTQWKLNLPRESGMQLAVQLSQGLITHFSLL